VNDVTSILSELERQKAAIERAIEALQEVSAAGGRSAGRRQAGAKKRRLSPEGRRRIAEAARRRWAALKAEKESQALNPAKKPAKKKAGKKAAEKKTVTPAAA
jgi:hypothetical protein